MTGQFQAYYFSFYFLFKAVEVGCIEKFRKRYSKTVTKDFYCYYSWVIAFAVKYDGGIADISANLCGEMFLSRQSSRIRFFITVTVFI